MITTKSDMLKKWAEVQLHALNPELDKTILLRGEEAQRGALEAVSEVAKNQGATNVKILTLKPDEMGDLIQGGDEAKIQAYHKQTLDAFEEIIANGGAVARFAGTADLDFRSRMQEEYPDHYKIWDRAETAATKLYRDNISSTGSHPWLVSYAPAEGDAAGMFPNLDPKEAIEAAWNIAFKVNMCDLEDPVAAWENLDSVLHERCEKLNNLNIEYVEITGHGSDAKIGFSELARYLGGSKTTQSGRRVNNNRPSFEVWTAPHRDQVEGVIKATVPFLCDGVKVEGLEVVFKQGKIVDFTATVGREHFKAHIENKGAKQLGEFALVDDNSPISGQPLTWQTLIEENRACHVAIGNAYKTNIAGGLAMSEAELDMHGVNRSDKHTDFMWGGSETTVIAVTRDGSRVPIIVEGKFVAPFAA